MRKYSSFDLIRFRNFSNENPNVKSTDLISAYNFKYPELSSKEKLINISKALGANDLHKSITGENIPEQDVKDWELNKCPNCDAIIDCFSGKCRCNKSNV